ncbi:beta-1,4-galactosyltransferase galt-1 [Diorhabda sublineata]|uniref:beta-1,4-galactosyltransferase galt-1 n=1 Tax=Diorhabda sublineata TaxID=1163346 RepID=UPI0024E197BC|nr:beta-1,4-galactosyltransferase galt-1 [Diorhabda sublineata]XP_056644664.1 beta-1,4-galactosyltransferase galt-1 [Diorhabda sublineata]
MSASSGGKKKYANFRNRQRASLSFFIVVMFFGVFGIIVFTEIFFIDERGRATGVVVRHGSLTYQHKQEKSADYEESEDYISIRVGAAMMNEDTLGALLIGGRAPVALPVIEHSAPSSSKVISETLLPPFPENTTLNEGAWQNISNTRYKFFVFSAYYDERKGQRIVRVIGATKTRGAERVWCRLWYKADSNSTAHVSLTVPAKIKVIRENWNLKYSACFVMCPLPANKTVPAAVSVVARPRDPPINLLAVINNHNETSSMPSWINGGGNGATGPSQYKFGVCVKPLHFEYNRDLQILEFIEFNRLLGVEHFTFYNHTIGNQVNCILKDYAEKGLVTILPWNLDMVSQKDIRTEGLFASLNDCLYRSMYKFSHILLIDLDEYILPKYNDTLGQMIDHLKNRLNTRSTGSFSFQNAFFYLQWDDDDSVYDFDDPVAANLVTLKKTRRKTKLHPHKQRSKYICRPEFTVEAGNHFVWEFIPGHGTLNVPPETAILHHYRICEFGGDDCIKASSVVDRTAYRFKNALIGAVNARFERLNKKCDLPKLTLPSGKVFNKLINFLKPS